jgi:hypothetical protein
LVDSARQLADDVGGWSSLCMTKSGASPQCGAVRVAQLHCGVLDGGSHHRYLGEAGYCVSVMFIDESIAQRSRMTSGECTRHYRLGELWVAEGGAMHRIGSGFVGEQKRCTKLDGRGTRIAQPGGITTCPETPGCHDRTVEAGLKAGDKIIERIAGRGGEWIKGRPMSSRVRSLGHQAIYSAAQRDYRFPNRGHRGEVQNAEPAEAATLLLGG